jgi:hypothetical protein
MSCATFVSRAFAVRTAAHIAHLTTTSYSQHKALEEFYTELLDLTDQYAEVAMGREGQFSSLPSQVPPKGEIASTLEDFRAAVVEEMNDDADSAALVTILTDIEELTLRTLYKLKNLK